MEGVENQVRSQEVLWLLHSYTASNRRNSFKMREKIPLKWEEKLFLTQPSTPSQTKSPVTVKTVSNMQRSKILLSMHHFSGSSQRMGFCKMKIREENMDQEPEKVRKAGVRASIMCWSVQQTKSILSYHQGLTTSAQSGQLPPVSSASLSPGFSRTI